MIKENQIENAPVEIQILDRQKLVCLIDVNKGKQYNPKNMARTCSAQNPHDYILNLNSIFIYI